MQRPIVVYTLLCAISLALYTPSFDNGFRDDDFAYLHHAQRAHGVADLVRPGAGFAFFRPGAWLLFAGEHRLFGMNAGRYLAFNWVLHLLNSLLLLFVLRGMRFPHDAAAWAAGLFAAGYGHYGKQVMWACTSGPLAAVTLVLAAVLLAIASMDARDRTTAYVLALLAGIVGLIAPSFHGSALIAPVIVLALWLASRARKGTTAAPLVTTTAAALAWLGVIAMVASSHATYAHWARTLTLAPWYLIRYVGLMALPVQHPVNAAGSAWAPFGVLAPVVQLLAGVVVLVGAVRLARTGGARVGVMAAWCIVALVPFSLVAMPAKWLELRYVYFSATAFNAVAAVWFLRQSGRVRVAFVVLALLMTAVVTITLEHKYDAVASVRAASVSSSENSDGASR